jgi:hypothetical protein
VELLNHAVLFVNVVCVKVRVELLRGENGDKVEGGRKKKATSPKHNFSRNLFLTSDEEKMSGSKKLSSAHSSCRLFCSGVPVISRLQRIRNECYVSVYRDGRQIAMGTKRPQASPRSTLVPPVTAVDFTKNGRQLGVLVFDAVGLVNDNVFPHKFAEGGLLAHAHLVRRDEAVPLSGHDVLFNELRLKENSRVAKPSSGRETMDGAHASTPAATEMSIHDLRAPPSSP